MTDRRRRQGGRCASALGVVVGLAVQQDASRGVTVSWVGPLGGGNWASAANWSTNPSLPGTGDDVVIGSPAVTLNTGTQAVRSVTSGGALTINGSATLTLAADSSVAGPFTLAATASWPEFGGIESTGNLVLSGGGTWTGGRIKGTGRTTIPAGATFQMNVAGQVRLTDGHTLSNAGTLNLSGNSWEISSATIENLPGAVWNATIPVTGAPVYGTVDAANLNNGGTLNKLGPGDWSVYVRLSNTGTFNVTSGRVLLNSGGAHAGIFNVSPAATLAFVGGTHTFAAGSTINGPVTLGGGDSWSSQPVLKFTGDNVLPAGFNWIGGKLAGAGKTMVPAGETLVIKGGAGMDGRTLENAGTISLGAPGGWQGSMGLSTAAAIRNLGGATFNIDNASVGADVGAVFHNAGTIAAGGTTPAISAALVNSGTVQVNSGTLALSGGGSHTGTITAAVGAVADFSGGTHILFPATATFGGPGKVRLSNSATLQVNGDNVLGNFEWTGGTLSGAGKTTVPAGVTVPIIPIAEIYGRTPELLGRTLDNAGTITLGPAPGWQNNMTLRTGSTLNNLAGATFTVADARVASDSGTTFNNAGTVIAGGTTSALGVKFNNSGTLSVAGGTLTLSGGGTHTGTISLAPWTVAVFSSGTHVLFPSATVVGEGTLRLSGSAVMQVNGDNTVGKFEWTGGTLTGMGTTTVPAGTTLAITPVYEIYGTSPELSARTLRNAGTITLTAVGGYATGMVLRTGSVMDNLAGGTFSITNATVTSDAGTSLNNAGTINVGGTSSSIGVVLNNTGMLNVSTAATVNVTAPVTQMVAGTLIGGTWNVGPYATLSVTPGANVTTIGPAAAVRLDGPNSAFAKINGLSTIQGALTISGGRGFTTAGALTNSGLLTVGARSTLRLSGPMTSTGTLTVEGTLDLAGQTLATSTPADELRQLLLTQRVVSSTALTGQRLGYVPAGASLLVKVGLAGDANLDGAITRDDFALIDRGCAVGAGVWWLGDFNYDGAVTGADYLLLDAAYLSKNPPAWPELLASREAQFGGGYVSQLIAVAPEPATAGVTGVCLTLGTIRRRRQR